MTADPEPKPDPRTAPEEDDVPNEGESADTPAEGADDLPKGGADSPASDTIVLAAVAGAHGVAGEVRLKIFADDLGVHRSFNDGTLTLTSLRGAIARFAEVRDRSAAEALRGTALSVPRDALPPLEAGEYYHADLIGLAAETPDGAPLGAVVAVENFGAGDVIEIERPNGKRFMVPMRADAVPEWDATRLVVAPAFIET